MPEILPMSTKERQRLEVIGHLKHGKTTVVKAAATLGLTKRQMYRILNRYRHQGDVGSFTSSVATAPTGGTRRASAAK